MSDHLIVIPVFDEAATIGAIIERARRHGAVLVVDDGSGDAGAAAAAAAGAEVLRLPRRRGKGAALQAGFAEALSRGIEHIVTLDGDGQHDPDDIPRLLAAARATPRALILGRRLPLPGTRDPDRPQIPLDRLNAMRLAGFFINALTRAPLVDTQSGFRVYPAALLRDLGHLRGGFVLETEVLVRAAARGWPLRDVAIRAHPVSARQSRFRPVADGTAVGCYLAGAVVRALARKGRGLACALPGPFRGDRRRTRHRELAHVVAPYRGNPAQLAMAVGVFILHRAGESSRAWWRSPDTRCLGWLAAGVAASPLLLAVALAHWPLSRIGLDLLTPFITHVYSQDRLAAVLGPADPAGDGSERSPSFARTGQDVAPAAATRPGTGPGRG